jgi:transmembrane protein EpsG
MTMLWINLTIVFICAYFSRYFRSVQVVSTGNSYYQYSRPNKILVSFCFVSLVIVSGLRSNIGDTFFYKHAYTINQFTWDYILNSKDIGFGILQMILKVISDDPQILLLTTAFITNLLIVLVLYKYTKQFELSLYVYITGGLFLVSMNGIRQFLAAAIIFTATKYLISGKWKQYMMIVLVGATFHLSALILIPIYFIARFKAWSKATFLLIFVSIIIVISYNQFSNLLFNALGNTQYGHYSDFNEGGANILRVMVAGAPLVVTYLGRNKLKEIFPQSDYIINMSIIGFAFMIISTQNWIFARFLIYFGLYQLILVSWIVKLFREKDQNFIYYSILVCYFLFYFYESLITLNIIYRSDYLIW